MRRHRTAAFVVFIFGLTVAALQAGQSEEKKGTEPVYSYRKIHDPDGIGKFYKGREIAQVMGHLAAGWLEREEREREEEPNKLLEALKLKPGDMVADVGAGTGYFTFRIAPLVGPRGKVYAVDIQPEMLDLLRKKMKEQNVTNIVPVLGTIEDPKLPAGAVDLILMVDVYHEFSHPREMTVAMLKALKTGGRLVLVEYRGEDDWVPIKPLHKMTERQVLVEMGEFPLKHVRTISVLPRQHIIVFAKVDEKKN
jgi:SAM-dependent methyltransferase